ncbi:30S ribosomal protein S9 [archaeon]|jgi:small subunit ribosomal protein S9|nr:30S ribosomal protein S9 [archaeon]MBT4397442.1 30S ribosomal protein S9 [archaeon]MBT4440514.1 30S ribosomal protein S9 [archaeon]
MKAVHASGKRKRAVARATITPGKGIVRINSLSLEHYQPELTRIKIQEPLILANDLAKKININIAVRGGGSQAQAEASRLAIARGLVEYSKSKELKQTFLDYDRNLLVADTRNKEACKPNDSKARAKRQKSYR